MRRNRLAAMLIVLLYAFLMFAGSGATAEAHAPRAAAPFAPCRVTVRCAVESALPVERPLRRQTERPIAWLGHAQGVPLAMPRMLAAPVRVIAGSCYTLLCVNHPQHAPPGRA